MRPRIVSLIFSYSEDLYTHLLVILVVERMASKWKSFESSLALQGSVNDRQVRTIFSLGVFPQRTPKAQRRVRPHWKNSISSEDLAQD